MQRYRILWFLYKCSAEWSKNVQQHILFRAWVRMEQEMQSCIYTKRLLGFLDSNSHMVKSCDSTHTIGQTRSSIELICDFVAVCVIHLRHFRSHNVTKQRSHLESLQDINIFGVKTALAEQIVIVRHYEMKQTHT